MRHKLAMLVLFCLLLTAVFSQNIRDNHFGLPVFGDEVAFVRTDSVAGAGMQELYQYSRLWLEKNFNVRKLAEEDKKKGFLSAIVQFKIDDANIKDPLYYTAAISINYKEEKVRINLHKLSYTVGSGKSKKAVEVTYQVKGQVRAQTDRLYPFIWDSLKDYAAGLLSSYHSFVEEKAAEKW